MQIKSRKNLLAAFFWIFFLFYSNIYAEEFNITAKEILVDKVEIEYIKGDKMHHYEITPYNYRPSIAKKITPLINEKKSAARVKKITTKRE